MSLLTPSESHAIQSFLTSVDHVDHDSPFHSTLGWPMYPALDLEDIPTAHDLPIPHGREALTKATKDLMSLLTPSESHAIQSFLTSVDHVDHDSPFHSTHGWPMYPALDLEDIPTAHDLPIPHGREALTKATKDLMSLDGDKWKTGLGGGGTLGTGVGTPQYQLHQPFQFTTQLRVEQTGFGKAGSQNQHYQQQQSLLPSNDIFTNFAFFKTVPNLQPPSSLARPPTLSIAPHRTLIPSSSSSSVSPPVSASTSSGSSSSTAPTPTYASVSVSSARQYSPTNGKYKRVHPIGNDGPSHKRRRPSTNRNPTLSLETSPTSMPSSHYGTEPLPLHSHPHTHLRDGFLATTPDLSAGSASLPCPDSPKLEGARQALRTTKATLLSASQKKANHIQSEQKRRANIRRGYEALCETVPALREALREEEASSNGESCIDKRKGKPKKGRVKVKMDGEKMDGRAGPRSENVVLSKTIEYITELLSEKEDLLHRLARARSTLPPGHHALIHGEHCYTMAPPPKSHRMSEDGIKPTPVRSLIWECEWTGGEGSAGEDDDDEEDCCD